MLAKDVMSQGVLTVAADATIYHAAEMLINARVSAMPVVDAGGTVVGIVSEADLIRRVEADAQAQQPGLLRRLHDDIGAAAHFVRSHSQRVGEVMTKQVITADENVVIGEIAGLMLHHGIKRIPITRHGRLVGVVSRINLLQALISHGGAAPASQPTSGASPQPDEALRQSVEAVLRDQSWAAAWPADVVVTAGAVHLWGVVPDENVRRAYRVAVERVPGVQSVEIHMHVVPLAIRRGRLSR